MIKVIKHGKTEFRGYCSRCGCEFTYELEDITLSAFVVCPDCGEHIYIGNKHTPPSQPGWPTPGEPIPCSPAEANKIDPCKDCDWMKKLLSGITYVGDIPCTWCSKGPYKVTCGSTNSIGSDGNSKLQIYNKDGTMQSLGTCKITATTSNTLSGETKATCTCKNCKE